MAKHFTLTIRDGHLGWARKQDAITKEEMLDGIYVIRTSEPSERLTAADGVRSYKRLGLVEQAFRCLKGIDLLVRPIHHRTADRVRATSCCACWRSTWSGTCGRRGNRCCSRTRNWCQDRRRRDPVAPARASESARQKKKTHTTPDGLPVQSFRTLLAHLGTRCRNTCIVSADPNQTTFRQVTEADALQAEALRLIKM